MKRSTKFGWLAVFLGSNSAVFVSLFVASLRDDKPILTLILGVLAFCHIYFVIFIAKETAIAEDNEL